MNAKIYVAGPNGFTESGRQYHEAVVLPALGAAGFEVLDPWVVDGALQAVLDSPRGTRERVEQLPSANRAMGRRNAEMIRECAGVLAFLDGSDVDSGTAAEIGYAAALEKPVIGIRTDFRVSGDNEATIVNLQVEWFVAESGGTIAGSLDEALGELARVVAAAP